MERTDTVASVSPATEFVRWEELYVSTDKGRREIHYVLKRRDGSSDLAVVGKEKSSRHMSYHYAIPSTSLLLSLCPSFSLLKLRSRKDVVEWLNSLVTDSPSNESCLGAAGSSDSKDAFEMNVENFKVAQVQKLGQHTKEFLWLGSPWTCKKRRRHYQSFLRNGVKISVHDFVFVLAEEDKRLVAYLEDMYEDSRANKMAVVRWFHKIDEVGIVLPHSCNDREIFFSLCLQDLSIECIDGLATVLSAQHFEKFSNEAIYTRSEPFVCQKQFENGDVKPFDITQVNGYWKQEILRFMYGGSPSKAYFKSQLCDGAQNMEENTDPSIGIRPNKRHRRSKDNDCNTQRADKRDLMDASCLGVQNISKNLPYFHKRIEGMKQNCPQFLAIGSQVEVLSQDSGIRGCWFRALIIKKHKDKVKVRYEDIKDTDNEAIGVEEWVLSSRVAARDQMGLREYGRTSVRPGRQSNEGRVSCFIEVGAAVDVWWHDGWWEGIVIRKESEDKLRVYFPGEKKQSVFGHTDLRLSQEWLGNKWKHIKERLDLVDQIISNLENKLVVGNSCGGKATQNATSHGREPVTSGAGCGNLSSGSENEKCKELGIVPDLSKDYLLSRLRWKSSKKRRRGSGSSGQKLEYNDGNKSSSPEAAGTRAYDTFLFSSSLKVDNENCKCMGDSLFSTSVVPPLTSLVMSM